MLAKVSQYEPHLGAASHTGGMIGGPPSISHFYIPRSLFLPTKERSPHQFPNFLPTQPPKNEQQYNSTTHTCSTIFALLYLDIIWLTLLRTHTRLPNQHATLVHQTGTGSHLKRCSTVSNERPPNVFFRQAKIKIVPSFAAKKELMKHGSFAPP